MSKLPFSLLRAAVCALLLGGLLSAPAETARGYHQANVTVTVTRVDNLGERCFDPDGAQCGAADYFALMTLSNAAGESRACSTIEAAVQDNDHITPRWSCAVHMGLDGLVLTLQAWDLDDATQDRAEPADILPGPGTDLSLAISANTNGSSQGEDTSVQYSVSISREPARLTAISLSTAAIDPSMDEKVSITGKVLSRAPGRGLVGEPGMDLNLTIYNPAAQVVMVIPEPVFYDPASGAFRFEWDGRLGEEPAAVALYTFRVSGQGGDPPQATTPTHVVNAVQVTRRRPNELGLLGVDPGGGWNPGSGPFQVRFWQGGDGSAGLRVFPGSTCGGEDAAPLRSTQAQPVARGISTLEWDGKYDAGNPAAPGLYSVELFAFDANGGTTLPASFCRPVRLVAPPELLLAVEHAPVIVQVGDAVTFSAATLTGNGEERPTGKIEIWTAGLEALVSGVEPGAPAEVCERAAVCSLGLDDLTSAAGRIAYKAAAADLDGTRVETGWRLLDVVDLSAGLPENPLMAGVAAQSLNLAEIQKTLDVLFSPAQDYLMDDPAGRGRFSGDVGAHIHQVWMQPSELLEHPQTVSFWVSLRSWPVAQSDLFHPDARDNVCEPGLPGDGLEGYPVFADVHVVLHHQVCHDLAAGSIYTASQPQVALFLAKDLLAGPDSRIFQACSQGGC